MAPSSPWLADAFAPVGLSELEAGAALRDRVDAKYVVDVAQLATLAARLAPTHRVLEIGGRRVHRYATTYFDTPDLRCFRDHLQGRRRRFKCRRRRYLDSGVAALELKVKGPRGRTVKQVRPGDGPDALEPADLAFLRPRVLAACGRELPAALEPVLTVTCLRVTLVALDRGERVTVDLRLGFSGGGGLREDRAIVESKSARGRATADRVLRDLGARPQAGCSKFCLGLVLARPELPANHLLPLLRRGFVADDENALMLSSSSCHRALAASSG